MRPWATASRSAAPIVTEAHVVPLPARSRCREEASPPAARTGTSAPSSPGAEGQRAAVGDDDGAAHAGRRMRPCHGRGGSACGGHALEGGPQHVDGLGPQLVQRPVAVDALAEVDLGQAVGPELLRHVDQQAELDAVAAGEAQLLEDPAVGRRLAGQGLAHPGQLGEEELEHGTGHQLGDPAAAGGVAVQRPGVEALDEGDVRRW